jgi:hypothetical protein
MGRALGVAVTTRHEGHVEEYIEFQSSDSSMRDRFGVVPSIPFEEGLRSLAGFFEEERRVAGSQI